MDIRFIIYFHSGMDTDWREVLMQSALKPEWLDSIRHVGRISAFGSDRVNLFVLLLLPRRNVNISRSIYRPSLYGLWIL